MRSKTKSERSEYAAVLGSRGGQARAKKLTPEQRTESARKAARVRWNDGKALKMVRELIDSVESGRLDLERARVCQKICQQELRWAALSLRAQRLGLEDAFFNLEVHPDSVKEYRAVTKQLGEAIRRQGGKS
jgi:hypothetical protein